MSEFEITLFRRKGSPVFMMQCRIPGTDKKLRKSTGETHERKAAQQIAVWQEELEAGYNIASKRLSWESFRELYEREVADGLAAGTRDKIDAVFNTFERAAKPITLAGVNARMLSAYQTAMREQGRAEATIRGSLVHLIGALRWAHSQGLLKSVPKVKLPDARKANKMKGRPITGEEFERMLKAAPDVVAKGVEDEQRKREIVDSWKFYLRGLWASGLRLAESMALAWDDETTIHIDDIEGRAPLLVIPARCHKRGVDTVTPMAPEFVELLRGVPDGSRTGWVFHPQTRRPTPQRCTAKHVGVLVRDIGKAAAVVVAQTKKMNAEGEVVAVSQFATAHDLRRSFGLRWSSRVMPAVLKDLMRHSDINTTMKFYVGRSAESSAAAVWEAHQAAVAALGASLGASGGNRGDSESVDSAASD